MAFTSWGTFNCEVISPLALDYSRATIIKGSTSQWRYTRHATKTYLFKGMDEATLQACLIAKKRQYNRRFASWHKGTNFIYTQRDSSYDYFEQVAQFSATRREVVYDLQIAVDETAIVYDNREFDPETDAGCASIESLFQIPGQPPRSYVSTWKYDEKGED